MKDYLKITGKTVVVTESGRDIDRGVTAGLASHGAKIMVADINDENGVKVRDEIVAEGEIADYYRCDVCKIGDIRDPVARTVEEFGTIDILVNNAGGGEPPCDFFTITDERWDHYIRFSLYSAFYMIREVFPYTKGQRKGETVDVSSGYTIGGGDFCTHYTSAKAGVTGLTVSIAKEGVSCGISANVIPVPTTDMPELREADPELVGDEISLIPLGWTAMPEDIANTVLFLISESADYVIGQIMVPSGGRGMLI